jgi:hypothetical protein
VEKPSGEWASRLGAGAEIVEGVEAALDASDGDTELPIGQVEGNDGAIADRTARNESSKAICCELGHRVLLA